MIKIIDRYIVKELIDPFIFGLLSFSLILSASMVLFELVRAVVVQGMPLLAAGQLFLYRLPQVMVYIFPMATLLAALLSFGRLSKDSEIIAFKASGISFVRIMIPVVILGILISLVTLSFYEIVVPEANKASKNLLLKVQAKREPRIQQNVFVPEMADGVLKRVFYARTIKGDLMDGVIVSEFTDGKLSQIINAKTATWLSDKNTWQFNQGTIYLLNEEGEYKHLIKFENQFVAIKFTPADFSTGDKSPDDMNIRDLGQYIKLKEKMGVKVTEYKIQLQMKTAIPFACLVFVILGAPLGLSPKRSASSVGLGISILIIFFYYVLMFASISIGQLELVPPVVAAWLPNIITGAVGVYFVDKAAKA